MILFPKGKSDTIREINNAYRKTVAAYVRSYETSNHLLSNSYLVTMALLVELSETYAYNPA